MRVVSDDDSVAKDADPAEVAKAAKKAAAAAKKAPPGTLEADIENGVTKTPSQIEKETGDATEEALNSKAMQDAEPKKLNNPTPKLPAAKDKQATIPEGVSKMGTLRPPIRA